MMEDGMFWGKTWQCLMVEAVGASGGGYIIMAIGKW